MDHNVTQLPAFHRFCAEKLQADNLNISFAKTGDHAQYALLHHDDSDAVIDGKPARLYEYKDPELVESVLVSLLRDAEHSSCQVTLYPQMKRAEQIHDFLLNRGEGVYRPCHLFRAMVVVLPDGTVIPCLSRRLDNVQDYGYDVVRLLRSGPYEQFAQRMESGTPSDACNVCCFARVK
jgi:hypothetical protein